MYELAQFDTTITDIAECRPFWGTEKRGGFTENEPDASFKLYFLYLLGSAPGTPTRIKPSSIGMTTFIGQMLSRDAEQVNKEMTRMRQADNNDRKENGEKELGPLEWTTIYHDRTSAVPPGELQSKLRELRIVLDKVAKDSAVKVLAARKSADKGGGHKRDHQKGKPMSKEAVAASVAGHSRTKQEKESRLENALPFVMPSLGITHLLTDVDPVACFPAVVPVITLFYVGGICEELNG